MIPSTDAGVSIGGVECAVRAANASCITCSVGNISAPGRYGVLVRAALGIASPIPPLVFDYRATIANVTPTVGSAEGGQLVTITGMR